VNRYASVARRVPIENEYPAFPGQPCVGSPVPVDVQKRLLKKQSATVGRVTSYARKLARGKTNAE